MVITIATAAPQFFPGGRFGQGGFGQGQFGQLFQRGIQTGERFAGGLAQNFGQRFFNGGGFRGGQGGFGGFGK